LTQKGSVQETSFYVTIIPAIELVERHDLDRWTPQHTRGYQRLPREDRFGSKRGSISRYLDREMGCFPTTILVNIRGNITYHEDQDLGLFSMGRLEIDGSEKLWILDGQHRVEALRRAMIDNKEFEDYPVMVSILQLSKRFEELMYFYLVNRRQQGVPTDLVYRHLQLMLKEKGEEWLHQFEGKQNLNKGKAATIVDMLNENPRSPWQGRIRMVTEGRLNQHIVRDTLMIRVIAAILSKKECQKVPPGDMADLLVDYWYVISHLYPEAFENSRQYTLLGAQGVTSLHYLFPDIYRECTESGFINEARKAECLSRLKTETPDHKSPVFRDPITLPYWSKDDGPIELTKTDRASIEEFYKNLREKISEKPSKPSQS
jgi:DGQHR domain-containing protein